MLKMLQCSVLLANQNHFASHVIRRCCTCIFTASSASVSSWNGHRGILRSSSNAPPPPPPLPREVVVLYRWPTMRQFRFISRFKVYQVSLMLLLLPPMTYMYLNGDVTAKSMTYASVAAMGTMGVLLIISYYLRRVVGEMAYVRSHDQDQLRLSTLTFFGGRRDLNFVLDDVVPFADSQLRVGGAIQRLEVTNHPEVFLYSLKYGRVLDFNLLQKCLKI